MEINFKVGNYKGLLPVLVCSKDLKNTSLRLRVNCYSKYNNPSSDLQNCILKKNIFGYLKRSQIPDLLLSVVPWNTRVINNYTYMNEESPQRNMPRNYVLVYRGYRLTKK